MQEIVDKFLFFLNSEDSQIIIASLSILKNMTENIEESSAIITNPNLLLTRIVKYYEQYIDIF